MWFASLTIGCASPPPSAPDLAAALRAGPAAPGGALRVSLAFDAGADLDLYVTDPALETVYFANTPSRLGGALDADRRCDAPAPRVETVRFDPAPAGRYRVGVDYPESCAGADAAPFALRVEGPGVELEQAGEVELGHFRSRALEFQVEAGPDGGAGGGE